jgi:hypothetical protein
MFPTSFDESNIVFDTPEGYDPEDVFPLSGFQGLTEDGTEITISCWKPTPEEMQEIMKTGRVWCYFFGKGMPIHTLSGTNPFKAEE